jgi:hypothetical protein
MLKNRSLPATKKHIKKTGCYQQFSMIFCERKHSTTGCSNIFEYYDIYICIYIYIHIWKGLGTLLTLDGKREHLALPPT